MSYSVIKTGPVNTIDKSSCDNPGLLSEGMKTLETDFEERDFPIYLVYICTL